MKKNNLIFAVLAFALVFVSCGPETNLQTTVIDFENVALNSESVWNGSDLTGKAVRELPSWGGTDSITNYYGGFSVGIINFENSYIPDPYYPSWSGFSASSKTDTITEGFENQYSVMNSSGALGSTKFSVIYNSASLNCPADINGNFEIKSLMLTNSTYAYLYMKKAFIADSWFKVIFTGYLKNSKKNEVEYYLSDFRKGKSFISKTWTKLDLSSLGKVDKVTISFDSTDKAGGWFNNPTYVCIDNIEFNQTISTKE